MPPISKKAILIGVLVVTLAVGASVYKLVLQPMGNRVMVISGAGSAQPNQVPDITIAVHIAGAVQNPGVYQLPDETRAIDAIKTAGGLLKGANLDKVNLAQVLKDGQRLFIPFIKPSKPESTPRPHDSPSTPVPKSTLPQTLISLNQGSLEELISLPGIGPKTAQRIIEKRSASPFESISDIAKIKGIGSEKARKIAPYVQL